MRQRFYNLRQFCMLYGSNYRKSLNAINYVHHADPQLGIEIKSSAHGVIVNEHGINTLIFMHSLHTPNQRPKYLFLIQQIGLPGATKIGICGNVSRRLHVFMTASPFGIKLIALFRVPHAEKIEQYMHHRYEKCHLNREWYHLNHHTLRDVIAELHLKYHLVPQKRIWN